MKTKNFFLLFMLLLPMLSMHANATNFYVNSAAAAANDQNAGTDPAAPWMSLNPQKWTEGCTVMLSPGTYIVLETANVSNNVTLQGTAKEDVIIEGLTADDIDRGSESPQFFVVNANNTLTVKNVSLTNFSSTQTVWGGMFNVGVDATLSLENVDMTNSLLPTTGGAGIYSEGKINCTNVKFENCVSATGGALNIQGLGIATLENVVFKNNSTDDGINSWKFGGAVFINSATATINMDKCFFDSNRCVNGISNPGADDPRGGAIAYFISAGCNNTLHITNSTFNNNFAAYAGGAINVLKSTDSFATIGNIDFLFANNTFFANTQLAMHGHCFTIGGPDDNNVKGNLSFINNTFVHNGPQVPTDDYTSIFFNGLGVNLNFINNIMHDQVWSPAQSKWFGWGMGLNMGSGFFLNPTFKGNFMDTMGGDIAVISSQLHSTDNSFGINAVDTLLTLPASGVPYLKLNTNSLAIDRGVSEFIFNGINIVPAVDIRGAAIAGLSRDAGAYEYNDTYTSVPKVESNSTLPYPNPFTDFIYLSKEASSISVFDLTGVRLTSATNASQINVSDLHSGIYLVRIVNTDGTSLTQKMRK